MSFWVLVQVFVNLILLAAVGFIWVRLHRPAKDDPRLSRGLQLLQSKISVLEDLSDRTETQVTQLTTLMEQKCRDIQGYVIQADQQIQKIEFSMGKSLEVAKIFQDKIPHQEIIERQNSMKYVKAARLAHQGRSVEEIAGQVDLSRGEIEFIAKVNREQLQFSEEDLPAWIKEEEGISEAPKAQEMTQPLMQKPAAPPQEVAETLSLLGNQFRQAFQPPEVPQTLVEPGPKSPALELKRPLRNNNLRDSSAGVVRKVVFPKIDGSNNLG